MFIVQPWFTAIGHPAQSTLNTARILGKRDDIAYLISSAHRPSPVDGLARELENYGAVRRFRVPNDCLSLDTFLGLIALVRARQGTGPHSIFFLDAHFVVLSALWPIMERFLPSVRSVSMLELGGPERVCARASRRRLVRRFLREPGRRVFLRTEELAAAWRSAFPEIPRDHIDTIPSLEIPDKDETVPVRAGSEPASFGVIGQIRPGKGLEWLVPLFRRHPELGTLRVAGTFTHEDHRRRLGVLDGYAEFDNRFFSEQEMLAEAAAQDYLVALYDDWDTRMEAATVYLAARVGRPVIVCNDGWCGRICREYGFGIAAPRSPRLGAEFFSTLPRRGDGAYRALMAGMARFRAAHSGEAHRAEFLRKVTA